MSHPLRIGIALAAALWAGTSGIAPAATRASVLVHAGFGFPEENNLRGGLESGFGVILPIGPRFNVAVEYTFWKVTSKQSFGKLYNGTLTLAPIQASLQYEFYRNMYFTAYGLGGVAYIVSRFRIGSYVSIPEVRIDQSVESGWALFGGLGANLDLSRSVVFYFEASYLRRSLPGTTVSHDQNLGDSSSSITANLRHVFLKAGLKLSF
jgi:opacity protein-like surface antigen